LYADPPSFTCVTITPLLLASEASSRIRPSGFSSWIDSILFVVIAADSVSADDMKIEVEDTHLSPIMMLLDAFWMLLRAQDDRMADDDDDDGERTNACTVTRYAADAAMRAM